MSPMADKYQAIAIFFQLNCHACLFTEVESSAQDYGNSAEVERYVVTCVRWKGLQ
jgi:hypothetical protein